MWTKRLILSVVVATVCFGTFAFAPASAQSYPNRLIKLVLPFPAGGPTDGAARLIAERLSASLGQTVVIENRPGGAGGTVGAKTVATADPDGYTLLFTPPGPMVTAPAIYKSVGYDPVKNFAPIATIFSSPQVLVVNPAVPARSMQELVAYAKANSRKVSYASPGFGTQPHLLGEMLKLQTGADIVHVPFRGSAAALTDLLAGQVQVFFDTAAFLLPHIEAGKLRPLAVADETRSAQLPDVPTTIESGFAKLQGTYWTGVVAPAGTPQDVVNKLNAAINTIMTSRETEETLSKLSAKAKVGSPADFTAFLAAETRKWTEVITAANIKGD
jgi:tripartite-type tricarboxylate transporter receptor subunit TctC